MADVSKIKLPDGTIVNIKDTVSGYLTTESDPTVPSWAKAAQKPTYTASEVGAIPKIQSGITDGQILTYQGNAGWSPDDLNLVLQDTSAFLVQITQNGDNYYINEDPTTLLPRITSCRNVFFVAVLDGTTYSFIPLSINTTTGTLELFGAVGNYSAFKFTFVPDGNGGMIGTFKKVLDIPTEISQLVNDVGYVTSSGAASAAPVQSVNGQTGTVTLNAANVSAVAITSVGAANGVVPLNASSKIDESYLPSYVDDVIEGYYYNNKFWKESTHTTEITGEAGKIYVDLTTDKTYRFGGTSFVEISSGTTVSVTRSFTSGTKVGTITVNGTGTDLYAPTPPSKVSELSNDSGFITGMTILSYGISTWQDFLDAYNANKVVYCRASSNSNPASGSQTRLAFMAYVNNATRPTEVEFQYYRSMSSHSATQQGDQVYVYKLASTGTWTVTVRKASPNIVAGTGLSRSYSNDTVTLSLDGTIPTKTSDLTNDSGFITGISSSDVTTALGYTPYNSTNPNGYVNAAGASAAAPVQSVNSKTGTVTLSAADVGALPSNTVIPTVVSTYASSGTDAVNGKAVYAALQTLDSSITATTNQAISAITITDGKITASSKITIPTVPSNVSAFNNDAGYITTESDPTVPAWAKASTPPEYILDYDEFSTVGQAQINTAKTGTPNYIPSGNISLNTTTIDVISSTTLGYKHTGNKLQLTGITNLTTPINIPTSATFTGNGVTFKIIMTGGE